MITHLWQEKYGSEIYHTIPFFKHDIRANILNKLIERFENSHTLIAELVDRRLPLYSYDYERSFGEYIDLDKFKPLNSDLIIWKCIEQINDLFIEISGIRFTGYSCYYPIKMKFINIHSQTIELYYAFESIVNLRHLGREYRPVDTILDVHNENIKDMYIPERDLFMSSLQKFYSKDIQQYPYQDNFLIDSLKMGVYDTISMNINNIYHNAVNHNFALVKKLNYPEKFFNVLCEIENTFSYHNAFQAIQGSNDYIKYTNKLIDRANDVIDKLNTEIYFNSKLHTTLTLLLANKNMFNLEHFLDPNTNAILPRYDSYSNNYVIMPSTYVKDKDICRSLFSFDLHHHDIRNIYELVNIDPTFKCAIDMIISVTEQYGYFNIILDVTHARYDKKYSNPITYESANNYSYLYPVLPQKRIGDNVTLTDQLLNVLFDSVNNYIFKYPYTQHMDNRITGALTSIIDVLEYYLIYEKYKRYCPKTQFVQITKTLMDDIVITLFSDTEEFIGGWYFNEIIDALNAPAILEVSDPKYNFDHFSLSQYDCLRGV
jgi:hypothetical protein